MDTLASTILAIGPFTESEAVGWTLRLAKRVEALHRFGVAHGGISAASIRVSGPTPRSSGSLADVREAPASPGYHSPEREGSSGVSIADDAWAIGVTLYFLLTGALPFSGETSVEVRQRMASPPPPLSVFGVDDDGLQRLIDQFLTRSPAQRVSRVAAMRELLQNWSADSSLAGLPALDEQLAVEGASTSDDDDDDDDNAATQMRDAGEAQALLAQALAKNLLREPVPARVVDPRRGTLLGIGVPMPTAGAGARPLPVIPPPMVPILPPPNARAALPIPPPNARAALPIPTPMPMPRTPVHQAPPVVPFAGAAPSPRFEDDQDDQDDGVSATLMLDAGALDVSAAIEEALRRNASSEVAQKGPSFQAPAVPAGVGSVGPSSTAASAGDGGAQLVNPWGQDAALVRGARPDAPPAPLAQEDSEGRGLQIALAVGVVLLLVVVLVVAVLYVRLHRQGA